jgi:peroxiredoxin
MLARSPATPRRLLGTAWLICLLGLGLVGPRTLAAEETLEDALAEIARNSGETISSWSADFIMLMTIEGIPTSTDGRMEVQGNKIRNRIAMDLMGQSMTMLSVLGADGVAWVETQVLGQTMIMKMDMAQMTGLDDAAAALGGMNPLQGESAVDPRMLVELLRDNSDVTYLGRQDLDGQDVLAFEMPHSEDLARMFDPADQWGDAGLLPDRMQLMIAPADGFVRLWQFVDASGRPIASMIYRNVEINPDLPESLFAYVPPEGAPVMDMTAMADDILRSYGDGEPAPEDFPQIPVAEPAEASQPRYNLKYSPGDAAPDFSGADPRAGSVRLADHRGKIVVLDFWASWSEPYREQAPSRVALAESLRGRDATLIGVSLDSDKTAFLAFLERHPGMDWPQVFDGKGWSGAVAELYGIEAIPHTIVIDRDGTIRHTALRGAELQQAVEALLAE